MHLAGTKITLVFHVCLFLCLRLHRLCIKSLECKCLPKANVQLFYPQNMARLYSNYDVFFQKHNCHLSCLHSGWYCDGNIDSAWKPALFCCPSLAFPHDLETEKEKSGEGHRGAGPWPLCQHQGTYTSESVRSRGCHKYLSFWFVRLSAPSFILRLQKLQSICQEGHWETITVLSYTNIFDM